MNYPTEKNLRPIAIFLSITLALSAIFYFLIIYSGRIGDGRGLYAAGIVLSIIGICFAIYYWRKRGEFVQ